MSEKRDPYGTGKDFQMASGYKEGFVKKEYGVGLAQSEDCCKAEEINLVRKIENHMKNLIGGLNSIESQTNALNKNLLPKMPKESEADKKERPVPQGWLECHLADLDHLIWRSGQIYDQVNRLVQATKVEN